MLTEVATGKLVADPNATGLALVDGTGEHGDLYLDWALRTMVGSEVRITIAEGHEKDWVLIERRKSDAECAKAVAW